MTTVLTAGPLQVPRLLWRESRPVVQVVFALRFWVAVVVTAHDPSALGLPVLLMGLCCTAVSMATYLANGVYDLTEDVANSSTRPLASGELSPEVARRAAVVLTVCGLFLAAATGDAVLLLVAVLTTALGWGYSAGAAPLKCSAAGTFVVSAAGGALAYAAGAISTGDPIERGHVVVFLLLSLWMGVGGASKDLGDAMGDRLAGRRTLPVLLGEASARRAIGLGSLFLGLLAGAGALSVSATAAPLAVLVTGAACVGASCLRGEWAQDRAARRRPYRAFMVTQYGANAALLVHSLP